MRSKPDWRRYEEHVLACIEGWAGPDATVEFDRKLHGKSSDRDRQIDILVTGDFAGGLKRNITAAIDCKCYSKKIDVTHAENFIGLIEDVQTDLGILITTKGWSKAAERRLPRGLSLRRIEDEPALAMAFIDLLPEPTYDVEWGEDHYSGDFWDNEPFGGIGAAIMYNYVERESHHPIDHPDELDWLDESLASDGIDKLNWSEPRERKHAANVVLRHYLGRKPSTEELEVFLTEVASEWEDGQEWSIEITEIRDRTGLWPEIRT
jgi:hypothetical protein